ncbi:hypothetical protein C7999DRAFT_13436 [Corynascus novoguineensis]|uniref:Uncharacterized protein n=1 Tax=Corynascus novoguineensis TaxID=1126955 RepID=A0AAN7HQZ9_9PEZI|nr:hypothetical protein C7999DRAFT_13436 [Corynascus novoguineensis]
MPATENLPIPHDINVMLIATTNSSNPAMAACCAPNLARLVEGCYQWCEIPRRFFDEAEAGNRDRNWNEVKDAVQRATGDCLRINGRNLNESRIQGWAFNSAAAASAGSIKAFGLWALLVLPGLTYAL